MLEKKGLQYSGALLAAVALLGGRAFPTQAAEPSQPELQEQIRALQQKVEELSKQVNGARPNATGSSPAAPGQGPAANAAPGTKTAAPEASGPPPLTWNGITLYGTVDIGVAYINHGAPLSPTFSPALPFVLSNYSNHPLTSLAPNGLSQSRLGISGVEPLGVLDLKGIFKLETNFNPTSGRLTDGPQSLVDNNGRANNNKITGADSSRAGQPFAGAAYVGISSTLLGTLTFGRQNSLMADNLLKYDPQLQSQAFSPISFSGTSGGLGDTEDKALDDTLKYTLSYGPARLAVLYQFGSRGVIPEGSESVDVGFDYAGLSVDALYGKVRGAVAAASLTATQNAAAPGTLAATISDNTAYSFLANYTVKPFKIYFGYEHMRFANPQDPLPANTVTIGGYVLSVVNNTAFTINKVLDYTWTGVRYSATRKLDVTAAYYHFKQNSFAANHCVDTSATSCSGTFEDASLVADYRWTRRFDTYAGVNYSTGSDGLVSGFLFHSAWAPMIGARFSF
jgi:predicted porin